MPLRHALAGVLILVGLVQQILAFGGIVLLPHGVGYALWLATLLLWRDIPRRTRWQAGALAVIGLGLLIVSRWHYGAPVAWPTITSGNTYVVAMLVGVSFIGLIGNRSGSSRPWAGRSPAAEALPAPGSACTCSAPSSICRRCS